VDKTAGDSKGLGSMGQELGGGDTWQRLVVTVLLCLGKAGGAYRVGVT